jgi:hypothetical protein
LADRIGAAKDGLGKADVSEFYIRQPP